MANQWNSTFKVKPRKVSARTRTSYIKTKGVIKRSTKPKAKKKTKADLWRDYGLERPSKPRYSGLKGIYWYLLSQKIRQRDFAKFGTCINCGRSVGSWRDLQGGHYLSAERCGFLLLFDETNVNGECPGCNKYDKQKLGYEQNLDLRYGAGTAFGLKKRYWESRQGTPAKEWSQLQYHQHILKIQKELSKIEPI